MLEFDAFQIGKGLSGLEAPNILPFGAFVQRLYEDGLYADLSGRAADASHAGAGGGGLEAGSPAGAASLPSKARPPSAATPGRSPICGASARAPGTRTRRLSRSGSLTTRRKPRTTSTPRGCRMRCSGSCRKWISRSSLSPTRSTSCRRRRRVPRRARNGDRFLQAGSPVRNRLASAFDSAKHEIEAAAQWRGRGSKPRDADRGLSFLPCGKKRKEVVSRFLASHAPRREKTAVPFNVSLGAPLQEFPIVNAAADGVALLTRRSLIR